MKALTLQANWEPRRPDGLGPHQRASRKSPNAATAWKHPRLTLADAPTPAPGHGDVLIKVKACGICGTDVHCCTTDESGYVRFSGPAQFPVILGHEVAGEVVEVGSGVKGLAVGQAVAVESVCWCGVCTACRSGNVNQCLDGELLGLTVPGALAHYVAVSARHCWDIGPLAAAFPDGDDLLEVGSLIEPIGCAYNGMFVTASGFRPGAYIAIHGAGPIGLGAVMLARAAGAAKILVFEPSEARNRLALSLGADFAADPIALKKQGTGVGDVIRQLTGGNGADMQIEAAGSASETIPEMLKGLARNGNIVYLGRTEDTAPPDYNTLVSLGAGIVGSRGHAGHAIFPSVIRLLAAGRLPARQMITARFPLERAIDAIELSAKRTEGKVIVRCA
jgi:threonine dehydrogenase-like Zn-dependent dehydrogenase